MDVTVLGLLNRNLERWSLVAFYSMLVVTMVIEVMRRELFSYSSIWGEEIVRYSFIYLVWIGAALAIIDRAHLRIDVIFNYASDRVKTMLYIFGDLVMFIVAAISLYYAWETFHVMWEFGRVSDGLRVNMTWFVFSVPFGLALVMLRIIQSLIRDIQILRDGKPPYEGPTLFESRGTETEKDSVP